MACTLPFARVALHQTQDGAGSSERSDVGQAVPCGLSTGSPQAAARQTTAPTCEHRTVSRDGRIVCKKIVDGQAEVSPNVCRQCPFRAVNCQHLRFSLRLSSPSPLLVRYNGRTELWDDGPAELCFDRAACSARVMPIHSPQACAECAVRQAAFASPSRHRPPSGQVKGGSRAFPSLGSRTLAEAALAAAGAGSSPGTGRVVAFPGGRVPERNDRGREEGEALCVA